MAKKREEDFSRLAEQGFVVNAYLASSLQRSDGLLSKFSESARVFKAGGRMPKAGERLRQGGTGSKRWLEVRVTPLHERSGRVAGVLSVSRDITESKRDAERIFHMAHHDALTGLPNRSLIGDRLEQSILLAERDPALAVLGFVAAGAGVDGLPLALGLDEKPDLGNVRFRLTLPRRAPPPSLCCL